MVDLRLISVVFTLVLFSVITGCHRGYREDLDYSHAILQSWQLAEIDDGVVAQFEHVVWEPDNTISLRAMIAEDLIVDGRDVLEIGTGTGILSILAVRNNARLVVATDINPAAVANARYNAAILAAGQKIDVRQVSPESSDAFTVVNDDERFDLILSTPPCEVSQVSEAMDHPFTAPDFNLIQSLLDGLPSHLKPGGRCLLSFGHRPGVKLLQQACLERGFDFKVLDDRSIEELEQVFLPGMLIEVKVPTDQLIGLGPRG